MKKRYVCKKQFFTLKLKLKTHEILKRIAFESNLSLQALINKILDDYSKGE